MRFPDEIERQLLRHGVDLDDVTEWSWTQKLNETPELRYRLHPDAQHVNIAFSTVPVSVERTVYGSAVEQSGSSPGP